MAVGAGVHGEGDDHGVVDWGDWRGAHARLEHGAAQDGEVELGVLEDFENGGVGQEGGDCGDCGVGGELGFEAFVAHRDVAGAAGGGGERNADEVGAQRVEPVGFGVDGDEAGFGGFRDPALQGFGGGHALVGAEAVARHEGGGGLREEGELGRVGGDGRGLGRGLAGIGLHDGLRRGAGFVEAEAGDGGFEALDAQEADEGCVVGLAHCEVGEGQGEGGVVAQDDELAGDAGGCGVFDEEFAALAGLHGGGGGEDAFEIAEFVDQQGGGFGADAGDAGDVVDRIAHQGLGLDEFFGGDAEFLHHLGRADGLVFHRVQHVHAGADELHHVLVGGDDGGAAAGFGGGAGVGGDEIVGLPVRQFDAGDAEGRGGFADDGELGAQVFRGFGALGLVGFVEAIAERGAPGVEDDGDMGADMFAHQAGEHVGEAIDGVDGGAVGPGHRRQGVEGAEDEARSVDEDQMRRGDGGRLFGALFADDRGVHLSGRDRCRRLH